MLAPAAILLIWLGGWPWLALLAVAAGLLADEWLRLSRAPGLLPRVVAVLATLGAVGATVVGAVLPGLALLVLGCGGLRLLTGRALPAAGVPYVGLPLMALAGLRVGAGPGNVLLVVAVVWASDVTAYAVGRIVGGPKLAPRISPGKTRSGAAGGLAGAILVGVVAAAWGDGDPWRVGGVAALLGAAAQAGDLFESWIKRRLGVKDSGTLIPGHGGLLDRLDALLAAAPVAALLAWGAGEGGQLWR